MIRTAEDIARIVTEAAADDAADGCGWLEIQVDPTSADFEPAFRIANEAGLLAVPHSGFFTGGFFTSGFFTGGFFTGADHVRDCVERFGARRIGHGTSAATDPRVLELLLERGVGLEVCPTSYPPLGVHELAAVPVAALLDAGVAVAPGWRWRWAATTRCCSVPAWPGSTRSAGTCSDSPITSSPRTVFAAQPLHHSSATSCYAECAVGWTPHSVDVVARLTW